MPETNPNKPFTPEEFKKIFSKVPRACVDLLIRHEGGVILLKRKTHGWENLWHFPGNMVLYRESIEDAVRRTAENEVGIKINNLKFLDYMEFLDEVDIRGYGYSVSFVFLCDLASGEPRPNEDSFEAKTFLEIPDDMIHQHRDMLEKYWSEITKTDN